MANTGTKTFVKVLKILFSIFLSFIFITTAFVLPIYYSVAGIFTPKTVSTVVQNIDFAEMITDSEEFNNAIKEFGIEKESVNEIMQSNEFGSFLESCTSTVIDAVFNDPESLDSFDPAVLKDIIDNHADDITNVLQEKLNLSVKKEDVQSTMHKLLDDNSDQIKENILYLVPYNEKSHPAYKIMSFIQTTLKMPVILLCILFEALLLGLIYLLNKLREEPYYGKEIIECRCNRAWNGKSSCPGGSKDWGGLSVLTALLLTAVFIIFKSNFITNAFISAPNILGNVATTMLGTVTSKLLIAIIVLGLIAAAAITSFILLKKYTAKKAVVAINENSIEPEAITEAEQPNQEENE